MKSLRLWILTILLCVFSGGCQPTVETSYAAVQRPSLNGIGVFVDLLRNEGKRVDIYPAISDKILSYDSVIVFHDEFGAFPAQSIETLTSRDSEFYPLLIALRDGEWTADYWQDVSQQLKSTQPANSELADLAYQSARLKWLSNTSSNVPETFNQLYKVDLPPTPPGRITSITARNASGELEALTVDIPQGRTTVPLHQYAERRWVYGDSALLFQYHWKGGDRVLFLGNSAPLLNAGLKHPGNRRLTELLLQEFEDVDSIAICASSAYLDGEADLSLWRFAKVFPHPWILGQGLLAIVLFCWGRWPVFGRPASDSTRVTQQFGKHVAAVGALLATTKRLRFAVQRIQEWQRIQQEQRKGPRG